MATSAEDTNSQAVDRRKQVLVGDLPNDFLRVGHLASPTTALQVESDAQVAANLQAQQAGPMFFQPNLPRLSITIIQAKLAKNYGLTRMDPYCRIRVGHSVFETQSAFSGGKNPRWNKTVYCYVPAGVDNIYMEIFDERTFMMDDRIAWAHIQIPETVQNGESAEDWYVLSGKMGEGKEGMVNLVLSYTKAPQAPPVMYAPQMQPVVMVQHPYAVPGCTPVAVMPPVQPQPGQQGQPVTYPQQQQQQQQPQGPSFTDDDINQVKEMFPDVEEAVIRSVFEANRGDKDRTINDLLQMNS